MAATSNEELVSLLSSFDNIYKDFKSGISEIEVLKSNCRTEIKRREALEITCNSLKQENERLMKLYTESLNNLADQLARRTTCQSLREELKTVNDACLSKENGYKKALESLKQRYEAKIGELEDEIRGLLLEKASNEAVNNHLRQDLTAHINHIQALANQLDQVRSDEESKYHLEIQDLRERLLVEQEEKNELQKRLQDLQKELLISRTKLVEQQRDLASNLQVESLKLKLMKLRKENEILRRKISCSAEN
ncbi:protein At-4/1 isoform X2 [Carica papaya]|uniref:protein At-4/1 isoform X2 n=1 Tax=Carica papaya TaxID=3649 RepID=UPI000B8C9454|nr:protein At-4/1 isoform X2 [Carica papaya]